MFILLSSAFANAICEFILAILASVSSSLLLYCPFKIDEKIPYTINNINKVYAPLKRFFSTLSNFSPKSNLIPSLLFLDSLSFLGPISVFKNSGKLS